MLLSVIPISEIIIKIIQMVLSKCVKSKMIPKMNFDMRHSKGKQYDDCYTKYCKNAEMM